MLLHKDGASKKQKLEDLDEGYKELQIRRGDRDSTTIAKPTG